ncbi:hypothetical protein D3C87_1690660 [compost metagenome]
MNPFNAPDLSLTTEQVSEALLGELRSFLLQIRKHCLASRLAAQPADAFTEGEAAAFLSAVVLIAAALLPRASLHSIECEALAVQHEARFLLRRSWASVAGLRRA